jgi:ribonuclease BN (tRNA processing enzyme)
VKGADLLISECTLLEKGYEYHLSLAELHARRNDLACGRIVLTHLGPEMSARRGSLPLETADDGMLIRL